MSENWRTDIDAEDYFGHQKKKLALADRRPVIRKASDLVGPGIAANATRITDFNDLLATYDGFFAADVSGNNAPTTVEAFVGFVSSDAELGGIQLFTGLDSEDTYQRVFRRNPSDPNTIYWGDWVIIGTGGDDGGGTGGTPLTVQDEGTTVSGDVSTMNFTGLGVDVDGISGAVTVTIPAIVESVTEGYLIDVDNTDPANPIIASTIRWKYDQQTYYGPGTMTMVLTHIPLEDALQIWWGSMPQPPTEWSVSGNVVTIPDPDGVLVDGNVITAHYAYSSDETPFESTIIPFTSGGWRYKQVAIADATDYSASAYDDSAWAIGSTMFGDGVGAGAGAATAWAAETSLWVRRTFPKSESVTITVPVEDGCDVYVNGTLVGSSGIAGIGSGHVTPPFVVTVADALTNTGENVLAIRANDEVGGSSDETSLNVEVVGRLL